MCLHFRVLVCLFVCAFCLCMCVCVFRVCVVCVRACLFVCPSVCLVVVGLCFYWSVLLFVGDIVVLSVAVANVISNLTPHP